MDTIDFTALNKNIDALLRRLERLKAENNYLQEKQTTLIAERNQLLDQNREARSKIGSLIESLKLMGEYHD